MTDPPSPAPLTAEEKAVRAASFGGVAADYERYRPGPPLDAVRWMLPPRARTVIDLGAGTGGLTRVLVGVVDEVIAVEPDDRMRAVLTETVPGARVVAGRAESMPLPDVCADAVLASSSWHWVEPVPALEEVARVLVPGGTLGAVWAGPDRESPFLAQAQALLGGDGLGDVLDAPSAAELLRSVGDPAGVTHALEIPPGVPFEQPEQEVITWDSQLDAHELIGLLGTFSWVILMDDVARARLFETAWRLLRDALGVEGTATVEVGFRADVWRARRRG